VRGEGSSGIGTVPSANVEDARTPNSSADREVYSEGLSTAVYPAAKQGAT